LKLEPLHGVVKETPPGRGVSYLFQVSRLNLGAPWGVKLPTGSLSRKANYIEWNQYNRQIKAKEEPECTCFLRNTKRECPIYLAAKPGVLKVCEEVPHSLKVVHNSLLVGVLLQEAQVSKMSTTLGTGTKTKAKNICPRNWNMAAIVEGDEPLLGEIPSRCLLQMELTARNLFEISMTGVA
jgi:hypothetical protein